LIVFDVSISTSYVPSRYSLVNDVRGGPINGGFGRAAEQVALFYALSWNDVDRASPLAIYATPSPAPSLQCTENRDGVELVVGDGRRGLYYDGIWMPGPGYDEQRLPGGVVFHWGRETTHSIQVDDGKVVIGVRGSRAKGIGLAELIRIANSIQYA
jgi:hypothetical protein